MNIALLSCSYYPSNEYAVATEQLWVWNTKFSIDCIFMRCRQEKGAIAGLFDVAFVWRYYTRPRLNTNLQNEGCYPVSVWLTLHMSFH